VLAEDHAQVVVFALMMTSKQVFQVADQLPYFVTAQWIGEGLVASVLVAYPVPICIVMQLVALADQG